MTSDDDVVTLDDIQKARDVIMTSPLNVRKTPILKEMTSYFPELDQSMNLSLKLEGMQTTGTDVKYAETLCVTTYRYMYILQYRTKLFSDTSF
jgi:hypothetical protein